MASGGEFLDPNPVGVAPRQRAANPSERLGHKSGRQGAFRLGRLRFDPAHRKKSRDFRPEPRGIVTSIDWDFSGPVEEAELELACVAAIANQEGKSCPWLSQSREGKVLLHSQQTPVPGYSPVP